jgi:hypothetical protein
VALLEKRRFLYNHSGDFPQVILIIPSHVPNTDKKLIKIYKIFKKEVNIGMINTWKGTGEQEFNLVPSSSYQRDSQAAVKILQKTNMVVGIFSSWVN